MTTIQEMVALRASDSTPADYAAAVTAAERMAKALARLHTENGDYFAQRPGMGLDAPSDADLSAAEAEARALLDELYPGWQEVTP